MRCNHPAVAALLCATTLLAGNATSVRAQDAEIDEIVIFAGGSQVELPNEYAGGQVARGGRAGILGNLDFMEAPFASTNYTEDLIRNQQAKSVGEVLKNDPVVRVAKGFGNFQELYMIRGFPTFSDDMTYNGIYGILPRQYVAAEMLERVEVFRGASSFLNGAPPTGSSVGGAVNVVPKRAPNEPLTILTTGLEQGGQGYLALDTARRFGDRQQTGVRVNVVGRNGETAVEDRERRLAASSVGVDYRGEALRLSADLGYQDQHLDAPRPSVTPAGGIPEAPDASGNYAQRWTYTDEQQLFGAARAEYDLNDTFTAWLAGGLRRGDEDNALANPTAAPNGDSTAYRFANYREDAVWSADTGIAGTFATGAIDHRLTASATAFSSESRNAYAMSDFGGFASSLYRPVTTAPGYSGAITEGSMSDPNVTEGVDTSSVAIADTLSLLEDRLQLTAGSRYQNIETESFGYDGAPQSYYDESQTSPVAGLVYRPVEQLSLYGNYIEGLIPGEVAPNSSGGEPVLNAGEVFEPYQAEQLEAGAKYDSGRLGGSISWFATALPSAYVENGYFEPSGEQRNRGLELSVFGEAFDSLTLLGGATFLDAEMRDTQGGLHDGNAPIGVPDVQVNLNAEWQVPQVTGLSVDGRAIYTASQYANAGNTLSVPSYTRWDLGLRYESQWNDNDLTLRARINNLTGDDYWASVGGYPGSNYLVLSEPRQFVLNAAVRFW